MRYLHRNPDELTHIQFQQKTANSKKLSVDLIEAGKYVEKFSLAYTKYKKETTIKAGIPIYGNWCGPGHGSGEPIDTLDAICQEHDHCYQINGYFSCCCDHQLIHAIEMHQDQMKPKERIAALAMATYFKMVPCIDCD